MGFMDDEGCAMQLAGMASAKPMVSVIVDPVRVTNKDDDAARLHSKFLWNMSEVELQKEI